MKHTVTIWDQFDFPYNAANEWAVANCSSLSGLRILDLSDVNHPEGDYMIEFKFNNEQDAIMFTLKWIR